MSRAPLWATAAAMMLLAAPAVAQSALAGDYDGSQRELAARLRLSPDGRFHYALSYGALDGEARRHRRPRGCSSASPIPICCRDRR